MCLVLFLGLLAAPAARPAVTSVSALLSRVDDARTTRDEPGRLAARRVTRASPSEERGRAYLAELYVKKGGPKGARKLLEEAGALEPGSYDAQEERAYRVRARRISAVTR